MSTLPAELPARMIVVSSIAGVRRLKNAIPYTVTKHGVIGLIRSLSEECMRSPIAFNAICPRYVDTDIVRNQIPSLMHRFNTDEARATAMIASVNRHQLLLDVDETTTAALWLCSDGADSINGQTIQMLGGQV